MSISIPKEAVQRTGQKAENVLTFDEWDALVLEGKNILLLGLHKSGKTVLADMTGQIAADSGRIVRLFRRHKERLEIPRGVQLIRSIRRESLLFKKQIPLLIVDDLDHSVSAKIENAMTGSRAQLVATMYCPALKDLRVGYDWLADHPAVSPLLGRFDAICTIDWRRRRIERVSITRP